MLDHLDKTKRKPNKILIEAEQVYQQFLVKGRGVALKAKKAFLDGGKKKVKKFAETLAS